MPAQTPQAAHQDPNSPPPSSPAGKKSAVLFSGPVETSWPKGLTVGSGLINTGNSCFLNSVLQCLLHTPPLLHVLLSHNKAQPCTWCHVPVGPTWRSPGSRSRKNRFLHGLFSASCNGRDLWSQETCFYTIRNCQQASLYVISSSSLFQSAIHSLS